MAIIRGFSLMWLRVRSFLQDSYIVGIGILVITIAVAVATAEAGAATKRIGTARADQKEQFAGSADAEQCASGINSAG